MSTTPPTTPRPTLTRDERLLAQKEKHDASELVHKLVLKVISWRFGPLEGTQIRLDNKISPLEWSTYKKHIQTISKTETIERVNQRIQETLQAIKSHNGFK